MSRPDEFYVTVRDRLVAERGAERFGPRELYSTMYGPRRILPLDWHERSRNFMDILASYGWTEHAPGPRGGLGWRLRPGHLAELQAKEEAADRLQSPHRAAAAAIVSPYATTTLCDADRTVELYWGWLPGGLDAGNVVRRVPLRARPRSRAALCPGGRGGRRAAPFFAPRGAVVARGPEAPAHPRAPDQPELEGAPPSLELDDLTPAVIEARKAIAELDKGFLFQGREPAHRGEVLDTWYRRAAKGAGIGSRLVIATHDRFARHPLREEALDLRARLLAVAEEAYRELSRAQKRANWIRGA